ncbi:MAG: ATPase [Prevotella sp.]|nr:ATPase [Prevotella sp.]
MKLIADSGSTKTDWCLVDKGNVVRRFSCQGINPSLQDRTVIEGVLADELLKEIADIDAVHEINFYGAGCRDEVRPLMSDIFSQYFKNAEVIEIKSDIVASARALFGDEEGIACILGTGSNSCLYDGKDIVSNIPPLGYILGDEGSGAVLGKLFVNALFKGALPEALCYDFYYGTGLTLSEVINKVYREPFANRFLASMSLYIYKHLDIEEIRTLVKENFRNFFQRNVKQYNCKDFPVGAVGSIAYYYKELFVEVAESEGYAVKTILKAPMDGLIDRELNKH